MNKKAKTINVLRKLAKNLYIQNKHDAADTVAQVLDVVSVEDYAPTETKKIAKKETQTVKTASEKPKNIDARIESLKDIYSLALEYDDKRPFGRNKRGK